MNKNLALFFIGTKIQSFAAALYSFGFIIVFYHMTNSLIYTGTLSACTIISSRAVLAYAVPKLRGKVPISVSIVMNLVMACTAFIGIICFYFWGKHIYFYFSLAIAFAILEEIDNSFQYSVIPAIVDKEYLFKANSLNAIFTNINLIVSPLGGYLFYYYSDLRGMLLLFGIICLLSSWILSKVHMPLEERTESIKQNEKKSNLISEWITTYKIVKNSSDITFCISIGVAINLIFAGLFGPVMLKIGATMSNQALGQTILKVILSVGSLVGVFGVYRLKVKENYDKYLNISITAIILILLLLAFTNQMPLICLGFLSLSIFIMFTMNSTGTFLQMAAPKAELTAIYAFRSTLFAAAAPLSYIIAGAILELLNKQFYFIFSALLVIAIVFIKKYSEIKLAKNSSHPLING